MRKRNSTLDDVVYYLICIASLGLAAFIRVIISVAIRKAIDNE